jgi:polyhydroxyalkanoate synthesis regulator phasin
MHAQSQSHPPAPIALNPGYRVSRVNSANRHSHWTLVDAHGQSLYNRSLRYCFLTKREAQQFLRENDVAAELAEEQRKEEERLVTRRRQERMRTHPRYSDWWLLRTECDNLRSQVSRLEQRLTQPAHAETKETLQRIREELRTALHTAETAANACWVVIKRDVDGVLAAEETSHG